MEKLVEIVLVSTNVLQSIIILVLITLWTSLKLVHKDVEIKLGDSLEEIDELKLEIETLDEFYDRVDAGVYTKRNGSN